LMPGLARAYVHHTDPKVLSSLFSETIFDANAMIQGFQAFAGWSVADKLDRITCPTLVEFGRYDLQTTPECAKRLSTAIPDAELVWLENSGHFPWVEEPDFFFRAVRDWLARHA
jgi:pimeloyl-ACP methyl ester carboxylesterase